MSTPRNRGRLTGIDRTPPVPMQARWPRAGRHRRSGAVTVALAVVLLLLRSATAAAQVEPTTTTTAPTTTTTSTTSTTSTTIPTTTTSTTEPSSTTTQSTTFTTTAPLTPPTTLSPSALTALRELNGEYEDLTAEELDLVKRMAAQADAAKDLADQVDALNARLASLEKTLAQRQGDEDRAQAHLSDTELKLQQTEDELALEQERLQEQAIEAYMGGGPGGGTATASALLRAQDMNEFGETRVYAGAVIDEQKKIIAHVRDLEVEADALRLDAEKSRASSEAARRDVEVQSVDLKAQRDERERLRQQVDSNNALQNLLLAEVSAKRIDRMQRIAQLTAVSDGISGTLAARQVGQQLPANRLGIFSPPLANGTISSPFGARIDPITGATNVHAGVDLVAPSGTPIFAVADGVVVIAFEQGGYGNCTVIDHGSGLGTLYGHQSQILVNPGDTVKRGQVIGLVGSTGRSTGPHLHWEVREFGQPVDPLPYLGR